MKTPFYLAYGLLLLVVARDGGVSRLDTVPDQ